MVAREASRIADGERDVEVGVGEGTGVGVGVAVGVGVGVGVGVDAVMGLSRVGSDCAQAANSSRNDTKTKGQRKPIVMAPHYSRINLHSGEDFAEMKD